MEIRPASSAFHQLSPSMFVKQIDAIDAAIRANPEKAFILEKLKEALILEKEYVQNPLPDAKKDRSKINAINEEIGRLLQAHPGILDGFDFSCRSR